MAEIGAHQFIQQFVKFVTQTEYERISRSAVSHTAIPIRPDTPPQNLQLTMDPRHLRFINYKLDGIPESPALSVEIGGDGADLDRFLKICQTIRSFPVEPTFAICLELVSSYFGLVTHLILSPVSKRQIICDPNDLPTFIDLKRFVRLRGLELVNVHPDDIIGLEKFQRNLLLLRCKGSNLSDFATLLTRPLMDSDRRRKGKARLSPSREFSGHTIKTTDVEAGFLDANVWRRLEDLRVPNNAIADLPSDIAKLLTSCRRLDLSHNDFSSISPTLSLLFHLNTLNLSHNKLSSLADIRSSLGNIQNLDISHNRLASIAGLDKMWALKHLDVSHNLLTNEQEMLNLTSLPELTKLAIRENPVVVRKRIKSKLFKEFALKSRTVVIDGTRPTLLDSVQQLLAKKSPSTTAFNSATTSRTTSAANSPRPSRKASEIPNGLTVDVVEDTTPMRRLQILNDGSVRVIRTPPSTSAYATPLLLSKSPSVEMDRDAFMTPLNMDTIEGRFSVSATEVGDALRDQIDALKREQGSDWLKRFKEIHLAAEPIAMDLENSETKDSHFEDDEIGERIVSNDSSTEQLLYTAVEYVDSTEVVPEVPPDEDHYDRSLYAPNNKPASNDLRPKVEPVKLESPIDDQAEKKTLANGHASTAPSSVSNSPAISERKPSLSESEYLAYLNFAHRPSRLGIDSSLLLSFQIKVFGEDEELLSFIPCFAAISSKNASATQSRWPWRRNKTVAQSFDFMSLLKEAPLYITISTKFIYFFELATDATSSKRAPNVRDCSSLGLLTKITVDQIVGINVGYQRQTLSIQFRCDTTQQLRKSELFYVDRDGTVSVVAILRDPVPCAEFVNAIIPRLYDTKMPEEIRSIVSQDATGLFRHLQEDLGVTIYDSLSMDALDDLGKIERKALAIQNSNRVPVFAAGFCRKVYLVPDADGDTWIPCTLAVVNEEIIVCLENYSIERNPEDVCFVEIVRIDFSEISKIQRKRIINLADGMMYGISFERSEEESAIDVYFISGFNMESVVKFLTQTFPSLNNVH